MGGENERVKELSDENRNAKEQVALVQERVRALQQEMLAKETQLAAARQDVQELRVHAVRTTVYRPDQSRLMTDTRSASRRSQTPTPPAGVSAATSTRLL